jgi:tetratricopeptide (TPR) repeat protein
MIHSNDITRTLRWSIALVAFCCSWSRVPCADAKPKASVSAAAKAATPASAPSIGLTGAAAAFQRSYDEEVAGRFEAAAKALDELPSPHDESYFAQFRRGWLHYRLGRHAESITYYAKAMELEPESIEARLGKLNAQLAARLWRDAEKTAKDVLKRDSVNVAATLRLAFAVFSQARVREAENHYRRVVSMYPSDTDAKTGLAWCMFRRGKRDEARKLFRDVLKIAPDSPLAKQGLRSLMKKNQLRPGS